MSGIQMMLFGVKSNLAQGTLLLNNRSLEVNSRSVFPYSCSNTIRYTFKSNGVLESSFTGNFITLTSNNFGQYTGEWISGPNSTPDKFSVRATIISGSGSSGTFGSWLQMNQDRYWELTTLAEGPLDSFEAKTCTIRFQLAESDNVSNILKTADVVLSSSSEYVSLN